VKKKAKVIILQTDNKSGTIWKTTNGQLIHTHVSGEYKEKYQPFNLYIVTDDEIKEGDYCIEDIGGAVFGPYSKGDVVENPKKIIATTDPDLYYTQQNGHLGQAIIQIPQIPQSFIEKYCRKGSIDEVEVEYERRALNGEWKDVLLPSEWGNIGENPTRPKVNSHNEITIHPIKDSWTRAEVYKIAKVSYRMGAQNHEDATIERFDEWFNAIW